MRINRITLSPVPDTDDRLADQWDVPITLDLQQRTLHDALRLLHALTRMDFVARDAQFADNRLQPITYRATNTPLRVALKEILKRALPDDTMEPLTWYQAGTIIVICSPDDRSDATNLEVWMYDCRWARRINEDGEAASFELLSDLIAEQIDPSSWRQNGGQYGSMTAFNGVLIIRQTPFAHQRVAALLKAMYAFQKPLQ